MEAFGVEKWMFEIYCGTYSAEESQFPTEIAPTLLNFHFRQVRSSHCKSTVGGTITSRSIGGFHDRDRDIQRSESLGLWLSDHLSIVLTVGTETLHLFIYTHIYRSRYIYIYIYVFDSQFSYTANSISCQERHWWSSLASCFRFEQPVRNNGAARWWSHQTANLHDVNFAFFDIWQHHSPFWRRFYNTEYRAWTPSSSERKCTDLTGRIPPLWQEPVVRAALYLGPSTVRFTAAYTGFCWSSELCINYTACLFSVCTPPLSSSSSLYQFFKFCINYSSLSLSAPPFMSVQ